MSPWIIIAVALLIIVFVLRVIFKITGLIIKLVLLGIIGLAIWWVFTGL